MILEKVNAMMADPEFMKKLLSCKSITEALACLNHEGAECTEEEGKEILSVVYNAVQESMNLDDMDQIAGGAGENNSTVLGTFLKGLVDIGANTLMSQAVPKKPAMISSLTTQVIRTINTAVNIGTGDWEKPGSSMYNPNVDIGLEDAAKKARIEAARAEMESLPTLQLTPRQ